MKQQIQTIAADGGHIGIAGPVSIERLAKYLPTAPVSGWPEGIGGTPVNNLVVGLIEAGQKVAIYTLDRTVTEPIEILGEQLHIYIGPYRPRGRDRMLDLFAQEARWIEQFIRKDKPALVHAHWAYEFALGAGKSGFPHLVTQHDDPSNILRLQKDAYRLARWMLNRKVKKMSTCFTVVSPYLNQTMKRADPVVPNAIPDVEIAPKSRPYRKEGLRFISLVSGWVPRKNVHTTLKSFQLLKESSPYDVEYHLYGHDYEMEGMAHRWAMKNGCAEGVHFHGPVDHSMIWGALDQCEVLVHPSLEESFGMVLTEAMARGLAVIGGASSGAVPWVLDEGKAGILCDVTNAEEVAHEMEKLVNDASYFQQVSEEGLRSVRQRFSNKAVTKQYMSEYEKLLKS